MYTKHMLLLALSLFLYQNNTYGTIENVDQLSIKPKKQKTLMTRDHDKMIKKQRKINLKEIQSFNIKSKTLSNPNPLSPAGTLKNTNRSRSKTNKIKY